MTVHVEYYVFIVEQEERIRRVIHECPKPLLALTQRLLCPFEVGDIDSAAHESNGFSVRVAQYSSARKMPVLRAVFVRDAIFGLEVSIFAGQARLNRTADPGPILRMHREGKYPGKVSRRFGGVVTERFPGVNQSDAAILDDAI